MNSSPQLPYLQFSLELLKALGPVLTALVAASIGYLGWRVAQAQRYIAETKLNHDLFDRRFEVYRLAYNYIDTALHGISHSRPDDESLSGPDSPEARLRRAQHEARFLFDDGITRQLSRILSIGSDYMDWSRDRANCEEGGSIKAFPSQGERQHRAALRLHFLSLEEAFVPYLKLGLPWEAHAPVHVDEQVETTSDYLRSLSMIRLKVRFTLNSRTNQANRLHSVLSR